MRRSGLERAFAVVMLLWFACITGAPAAFHSCPVHDATRAPAGAATHDAHSHHLPAPHGDHGACTCIGDCRAGGVAPGIPAAGAALPSVTRSQLRAPLPRPDSPALAPPAFLLPYANGPPGARRVA
jgi:hypothetical protein